TAVGAAVEDPFHGGLTGVEEHDLPGGDLAPVHPCVGGACHGCSGGIGRRGGSRCGGGGGCRRHRGGRRRGGRCDLAGLGLGQEARPVCRQFTPVGRVGGLQALEVGVVQQFLGFLVGNALVAVDAGLAFLHGEDMLLEG